MPMWYTKNVQFDYLDWAGIIVIITSIAAIAIILWLALT